MWKSKIEKVFKYDYLITRWRIKKKYWFFGEYKEIKQQFRGACTVWHHYPQGNRCSTYLESWLCDIWEKNRWKEEENRNRGGTYNER